jgi:peroxiredoxin
MQNRLLKELACAASAAWLFACAKAPSDAAPTAAASTRVGPSASVAAAKPTFVPPTPKEYAATAAERVGVLAAGTGIAVGQPVPEVRAQDLSGKDVSLASLYAGGPILLAFYRGGWCPYCNMEIHSLSVAYPEFQKRGVTPVALSVDRPEAEAMLKATYTIPFPVLSDPDAHAIEAFHLIKNVSPEELAKMRSFGIDLEAYSGRTHHQIAIPALFLIDHTGVVRWAHSDPDFKVRPSTAQILAAIDAAKPH